MLLLFRGVVRMGFKLLSRIGIFFTNLSNAFLSLKIKNNGEDLTQSFVHPHVLGYIDVY